MRLKKPLVLSLIAVAVSLIVANLMGKETAILVGNLGYTPITISLTSLTIVMAIKFRAKSIHGIAWIMFLACTISWMVAEHMWSVEELVLHVKPFPSSADIFYVLGYIFLILFTIYYLKVVKKAITKKMILVSVAISIALLLPSLYMTLYENSDVIGIAFLLAFAYPVLDSIVLVPALIGIMMFFKGEVNKMWTFFSLAIVSLAAGDTGFLLTEMNGSYYTGHPVEILLMWSYVLFLFGVYSQYMMFSSKKNFFEDKKELR
ncbi:MAG: hypothetical protein D4R72_04685 [Nitrosopumilales archaeon]|nr:MAG: hypothetical protein D4R72_04685 [Nitrosopumilales archaeon]